MSGADVDKTAVPGPGTVVWHLAQVREGARVGAECTLGRGARAGAGVRTRDLTFMESCGLLKEVSP
ncbi:hypothetical protein ACFSL4_07345 [Streptomyces caeni]|uniref:Uncharacterized protein n=1 Tax=Streptomyces caeni TaxID=2307231 RepID=A0ABW4IN99_9ACTN